MDYRIKDMTNKKFGRLTAKNYSHTGIGGAFWLFQCDCGTEKIINGSTVRLGKVVSCGCYAKEIKSKMMKTHGMSKTRTYNIWVGIKQRCLNPKDTGYENYGGKGITISEEWLDFTNFLKDMGEAPNQLTIERINNLGNNSKDNCIWASRSIQNINKGYINKTTGIKNISFNKKINSFEVGIARNKKRYRKNFQNLDDAIAWKKELLKKLDN